MTRPRLKLAMEAVIILLEHATIIYANLIIIANRY